MYSIAADLRTAVYGVIAKQAKGLDTLLAMYRRSEMQEEKQRLLSAIGSFYCLIGSYINDHHDHNYVMNGIIGRVRGTDARRRVLEWGFSKDVRKGDIVFLFSPLAASSLEGRTLAWDYLCNNWTRLMVINIFTSFYSI
jgi:hypothetical protein